MQRCPHTFPLPLRSRDVCVERLFAVQYRCLVVSDERFGFGESPDGQAVEETDGDWASDETRHGPLLYQAPPFWGVDVVNLHSEDHMAEIDKASIRRGHHREAMRVAAFNVGSCD